MRGSLCSSLMGRGSSSRWTRRGRWIRRGAWRRGIDVGKYEALCLIADHRGELVGQPLAFPLTEVGAVALERELVPAGELRAALSVRVGVETAGHYHRTIVSRLVAAGHGP